MTNQRQVKNKFKDTVMIAARIPKMFHDEAKVELAKMKLSFQDILGSAVIQFLIKRKKFKKCYKKS